MRSGDGEVMTQDMVSEILTVIQFGLHHVTVIFQLTAAAKI